MNRPLPCFESCGNLTTNPNGLCDECRTAEREREARETVPFDRDAFPSGTVGPWGDAA